MTDGYTDVPEFDEAFRVPSVGPCGHEEPGLKLAVIPGLASLAATQQTVRNWSGRLAAVPIAGRVDPTPGSWLIGDHVRAFPPS